MVALITERDIVHPALLFLDTVARGLILSVHPTRKRRNMQATPVEASMQIRSIRTVITLMVHVYAIVLIMLKPIDVANNTTITQTMSLQPIAVEVSVIASRLAAGLLLGSRPRRVATSDLAVGWRSLGNNRGSVPAAFPPAHSIRTPSMATTHSGDLVVDE